MAAPTSMYAQVRADVVQRARNYLSKVPGAISGQSGHNQTFKAACRLVQLFGLTDEEAMSLLREWNQKCQPPWDEKDLQKKLRDARANVSVSRPMQPREEMPKLGANEAVDDPHRLAELYLSKSRVDGMNTLVLWSGEWHRWTGVAYVPVAEAEIKADFTRTIKAEFDQINRVETMPVAGTEARTVNVRKVTAKLMTDAMQALRSLCMIGGKNTPPCWLDDEERVPANEVLVAQNGYVHLPSLLEGRGQMQELTPNLFTTIALDYSVEENAPEPTEWLKFLGELWPNDPASIALVQEWFGYCLAQDTKQQKMLMIVGPKRSGKGTIAWVLSALVGQANVAGPTSSGLADRFGLSALINKPVAIIADARFSGRAAEQAVVVERLLSISGEDTLTIDRKNRDHLTVKLPTRFMIMTNELPRMADASGAFPSRLLTLQLTATWYGKEDTGLLDRLLCEKAGIFKWACDGLRRLRGRGYFVQPESGMDMARRLEEFSSPVLVFVQDKCELGTDKTVSKDMLYQSWKDWCSIYGHEPGNMVMFARNLMAAYPEVDRPDHG